ncbi:hypothetical protein JP75_03290 [Devosia riboflavina]|uniref:Uncharacterized protein n=1 Tax=Devosia riboflavina TaxID=46914 RepID=A0A087M6S7_9HYPH|nr:hypothetical protein JP75_03290 [Devosia riboflavina]
MNTQPLSIFIARLVRVIQFGDGMDHRDKPGGDDGRERLWLSKQNKKDRPTSLPDGFGGYSPPRC